MLEIIAGLIVVVAIVGVLMYNGLVTLRNNSKNAWAQIDVQLKRRADLIPNLVETVKGYMKHERETLESVTKARTALMSATGPREKAKAEGQLAGALKTLFAVAESYPTLKANENFMQLQEELSGTETKIAYARQLYNDVVLQYNNSIQTIPSNIVAALFGFKEIEFFKTESEAERQPVKVKF
ncbi:LemA family protein [uncultured archaeon]|nr:LemA family protein [uncultured archaeon]